MTDDHRHCDDLFAPETERAIAAGNAQAPPSPPSGISGWRRWRTSTARKDLSDAFEAKTGGMTMGPTQVMRMERPDADAARRSAGCAGCQQPG